MSEYGFKIIWEEINGNILNLRGTNPVFLLFQTFMNG